MYQIRVEGDAFDAIVDYLDRHTYPDLMPLALELQPIMVEDNRAGLMAGLDWNDDAMAEIEESTRKRRGGAGPPLVPRDESSRAISDYRVDIEDTGTKILLVGHWPNTPFIHFHVTGFTVHTRHGDKGVPARDPTGIRAEGRAKIAAALHDFAMTWVATT